MQWEKRVELIFDCHQYSEEKKVKLAVTQFQDYAISWWEQLVSSRRRNQEYPIETWHDLKTVMKKRFVPRYYHRELMQRLQVLRQGSRSVKDYYKEMEMIITQADLVEDEEATMARFLGRLNKEIADRVELQHYVELEDMVHLAIRIEKQLQSRGATRYVSKPSSSYNSAWKGYGNSDFKGSSRPAADVRKGKSIGVSSEKPKEVEQKSRNRDIKCWKCQGVGHISKECPNRRTMVMRNGEIVTDDEGGDNEDEDDDMPEFEDYSDAGSIEEAVKGDLFVARHALNTQLKEDCHEEQRENPFHTRCHV